MMDIELSNQVFFDPSPQFITWLRKLFPGPIVDVGAGVGRLGRLFGPGMTSIDLLPRSDSESTVLQFDAMSFNFAPFKTAVIARPNRGAFVGNAIARALSAHCVVIYIGKQSRYEDDLLPFWNTLPFKNKIPRNVEFHDGLGVVDENGRDCVVVTIQAPTQIETASKFITP